MMAGIGIGAMAMPPIAQHLITTVGWRSTYAIMGVVTLVVSIPIVAVILKDGPEELGLRPDGAVDSNTPSDRRPERDGLAWRAARSSRSRG